MKTQLAALALSLVSASVFAGTANISGNYSGTYNLEVRTTSNALMAKSSQA